MEIKKLLSVGLLLFTSCLQAQVIEVYRNGTDDLKDSLLWVDYSRHGRPVNEMFYSPNERINLSANESGALILRDLTDSSIVRLQVDSRGGYIEISGLEAIGSDTLKISGLRLIENRLSKSVEHRSAYFKHRRDQRVLEPYKNESKSNILSKATDLDTTKSYLILINTEETKVSLRHKELKKHEYHASGIVAFRWYRFRSRLLNRDPHNYKSFGGSSYQSVIIWYGEIKI